MYKGDLKRLILGYAERIQSTFTMGEAFGAIKEADNRSEVSNAISELYRDGKLARQKANLGNSYLYALPAFAPAAFEMNTEQSTEQNEPQKPQDSPETYIEKKIDEIRTAADQEEDKPAESPKAAKLVSETERETEKQGRILGNDVNELRDYLEGINENIPDEKEDSRSHVSIESIGAVSEVRVNIPVNSRFTLAMPNGMSITIESGA